MKTIDQHSYAHSSSSCKITAPALYRHCTDIAEVMGSNLVQARVLCFFFQALTHPEQIFVRILVFSCSYTS